MIGILGGTFDPPHNGHVALARAARRRFNLERLVVLVAAAPGHKSVATDPDARLELARAAFPDEDVVLDEHPRTVDAVAGGRFGDAIFLVGADEFCDFLSWKDPEGVLREVKLGVATRPGFPRERLQSVLDRLSQPERVAFFEITPLEIASREIRRRVGAGEAIDDLVPRGVAERVDARRLYRASEGAR